MRLFLAAFMLSGIITASTAFAKTDEPLTGGSTAPGHARFEANPGQEYFIARIREEAMHRDTLRRYYDWIGYNYATPSVSVNPHFNAIAPVRTRRIYSSPGYWIDSRGYGF